MSDRVRMNNLVLASIFILVLFLVSDAAPSDYETCCDMDEGMAGEGEDGEEEGIIRKRLELLEIDEEKDQNFIKEKIDRIIRERQQEHLRNNQALLTDEAPEIYKMNAQEQSRHQAKKANHPKFSIEQLLKRIAHCREKIKEQERIKQEKKTGIKNNIENQQQTQGGSANYPDDTAFIRLNP